MVAAVAFVAVVGTVAMVALGGSGRRGMLGASSGTASARGDWTHKELASHLKAKGFNLEMMPAGDRRVFLLNVDDPWWRDKIQDGPEYVRIHVEEMSADECAIVTLMTSEQDAREAAGTSGRYWSHGRFLFQVNKGGEPFLARIQKALN